MSNMDHDGLSLDPSSAISKFISILEMKFQSKINLETELEVQQGFFIITKERQKEIKRQ